MYYTPGHFFEKSATGCLVHHYSYRRLNLMVKDGGYQSIFPYIGANKHHRQRKFVRRSTKHSVVQSTCKMSRGWMMRRELRSEGLVGRARRAMARSFEGTQTNNGFQLLVSYVGIGLDLNGLLANHLNTTR